MKLGSRGRWARNRFKWHRPSTDGRCFDAPRPHGPYENRGGLLVSTNGKARRAHPLFTEDARGPEVMKKNWETRFNQRRRVERTPPAGSSTSEARLSAYRNTQGGSPPSHPRCKRAAQTIPFGGFLKSSPNEKNHWGPPESRRNSGPMVIYDEVVSAGMRPLGWGGVGGSPGRAPANLPRPPPRGPRSRPERGAG